VYIFAFVYGCVFSWVNPESDFGAFGVNPAHSLHSITTMVTAPQQQITVGKFGRRNFRLHKGYTNV